MIYSSMPILTQPRDGLGALLVWSVLRRDDVRAALRDFGQFRISDFSYHDDIGSCRKKVLRARAKSNPIFAFNLNWLMPFRLYSMGSSAVEILSVPSIQAGQHRIDGRCLPASRGTGNQYHPLGFVHGGEQDR